MKMKRWWWLGVWWWQWGWKGNRPPTTPLLAPGSPQPHPGLPLYCLKTCLDPLYAYLAGDLQDKEEYILDVGSF